MGLFPKPSSHFTFFVLLYTHLVRYGYLLIDPYSGVRIPNLGVGSMEIILFCIHKGGCGKTTSAINLSTYLALAGKKTLLIDLDPQAASTTGLGIDETSLQKQT